MAHEEVRHAGSAPLRLRFRPLRTFARRTKDGPQARRLLALAAIYDGGTRTEAARIGGVGLQIVRDWVVGFNAAGPRACSIGKAPASPRAHPRAPRGAGEMVESGPIPAVHGVVRWRLIDLAQWVWEEFRISIGKQTLSRELRALGYRKLSARPRHHAQSRGPRASKKLRRQPGRDRAGEAPRGKPHRDLVRGRGPDRPEEQDHAALGAARDAASAPHDQRTPRPTSSARSARPRARPPVWSCPSATPTR